MGAAIVDHQPKTHAKDISEKCLSMLKRNVQDSWRRFVTVDETWIHHLHTRDETTVEAVSSAWWKCADKGKDTFIGREADGHCFLGCLRNHPYWLFAEGSKNDRGILCNTSKPFARKTVNGTSEIGAQENPFSSRRFTLSQFQWISARCRV